MRVRLTAILMLLALAAAACGNSPGTSPGDGASPPPAGPTGTVSAADLTKNVPVDAPGVTDTEIHVGGVVSKTNPLGGEYDQTFKGVQAYFNMINEQGGIYGRQLELTSQRDDQLVNNQLEVQGLISEDDVFAVLPVANIFTFAGAQTLADANIPTFGWNVNAEWANHPNLFGEKGSFLCFTCAQPYLPWLAKKLGKTKVAILGFSVAQSADCAAGVKKSFEKWPTAQVVFEDPAVEFSGNPNLAPQVGQMKAAGVDLVTTCMDDNGVTALAQEMKKENLDAVQFLPNGYNYETISKFKDVLQGSYVLTGFVPFESADPPKGLRDYLTQIAKVDGAKKGELSLTGWLNANLFVAGLKAAGPEFSRQKVIDGINAMTNWNADGINAGIDWTRAHTQTGDENCFALSKIDNGGFVPEFVEPGKPFICLDYSAKDLPDNPPLRG